MLSADNGDVEFLNFFCSITFFPPLCPKFLEQVSFFFFPFPVLF